MTTFLENLSAFWAEYGLYINAAVIPTIITGLTLSPKTAKAAGWVPKIWDGIKRVMDFLSVLTHKDKPGTFQLPLKANKLLEKKTDAGPAAGLILVVLISSQASCGALSSATKDEVKRQVFDCAMESAQSKARPLVLTMLGVLTGASDDTWKKQTKTLAKEFGTEAVACATRYAMEKITNPVQSEEDPEQLKLTAVARMRALHLEEGWDYTP